MLDYTMEDWKSRAAALTFRDKAFIDGKFVDAVSGKTFQTINPATGAVPAEVAECDAEDVDRAVAAARRAFEAGSWSRADPGHRKTVLLKLAELIRANLEEMALLDSLDMGKLVTDAATIDAPGSAFFFQWYAEAIDKVFDEVAPTGNAEDIERTRGQETELPQVLRWSVARADEDYDSALVEARRVTTGAVRVSAESFPVAVAPEEAERRCRRALMDTWTGRERAAFALPPSRLAFDPGDVVVFKDGIATEFRLTRISDGLARRIEATRQDHEVYDLLPGAQRAAAVARSVPLGAPQMAILDLPQLTSAHTPPRPLIAVDADPWPGTVAVLRSPETSGWSSLATITRRARIGTLVTDLPAGPAWRWDRGAVLEIDLPWGQLESVTDLQLFAGANAFAVESAPGTWEILQARDATLIAPGRYRLTTLLRGQRGTEHAIGNPAPAGARVVVLDAAVTELPFTAGEIGLPWNLAVGPATRPVSDPSYTTLALTPSGASLRPFAPVHLGAKAEPSGDVTITWTRRSRDPAADSWEAAEVPLLDQPEAWEVDILDGATVKRTLAAGTASATYSTAEQIADWGAALAPDTALIIRVAQLSPSLGRGTPAETTVTIA